MTNPLRAVLFDKDGTLVDFHATWDGATGAGLEAAAPDRASLIAAADAIGYDLVSRTIRPDSVFIAESNEVIFAALEPHVDLQEFGDACMVAARTSTAPADGLPELLHALRARDIALGVATNDWAEIARDQLGVLGWTALFDVVMGSDSGFGAKPDPEMLLEAARQLGAEPDETLMVGDTAHDVQSGRAAGMATVLVTGSGATGPVPDEAAALADLVITSLADLESTLIERGHISRQIA